MTRDILNNEGQSRHCQDSQEPRMVTGAAMFLEMANGFIQLYLLCALCIRPQWKQVAYSFLGYLQ